MPAKIVNFHCHPAMRFYPERGVTPESCDDILRSDEFDLFCMSPLDLRHLPEDAEYPYMTSAFRSDNETVARLRDRFPGKIVPFAYVDPRKPDAAETVRQCVEKEGFGGLKLYPPIGFYPDAPELVGFFEAIDDLAIPILLHAGRVAPHPGLRAKYADPIYLEGVALTARRCAIVVGHAGNPWKDVTFGLAAGVKNLYIDLTTSGGSDPAFVARVLRHPDLGAGRMVWGSDGLWKAPDALAAMRQRLQGIGATDDEQALMLGGVAERLLRHGENIKKG